MEMKMFIIFVVMAVTIHSGASIKCFVCDSMKTKECADMSNTNLTAQECTVDLLKMGSNELAKNMQELAKSFKIDIPNPNAMNVPMVCQKTVATGNGQTTVIRGCQVDYTEHTNPCTVLKSDLVNKATALTVDHCSLCKVDGCNGSDSVKASLILAVPALLGVIFALKA